MEIQNDNCRISKYIKERVDNQINWYDDRSKSYQKKFKILKIIIIISSAIIPVIVNIGSDLNIWIKLIVSSLGATIVILESVINLNKYNENWISYRSICETLKHEKYMFIHSAGVYQENNDFDFFVERIESIISQENLNWASLNKTKEGNKNGP